MTRSNELTTSSWPRLRAGDHVRLVSPASYPDPAAIDDYTKILQDWGFEVEVGEHVLDRRGYTAGRDEDRLADLNAAYADPTVRAVITTRGGAGAAPQPAIDLDRGRGRGPRPRIPDRRIARRAGRYGRRRPAQPGRGDPADRGRTSNRFGANRPATDPADPERSRAYAESHWADSRASRTTPTAAGTSSMSSKTGSAHSTFRSSADSNSAMDPIHTRHPWVRPPNSTRIQALSP